MSSPALNKYKIAIKKVDLLRQIAALKGNGHTDDEKQIIYHAALSINVASWDSFINDIVKDYYQTIANPLDLHFNAIHGKLNQLAITALTKFNTPNWENTRSLFISYTGYDPYADWVWPAKNMSAIHVQERLNQILKVRHSFAHGFNMPAYNWNQAPSGKARLTSAIIIETKSFFDNIALKTEVGLKNHIANTYSVANFW